jgi:hypothetical protein
MCRIEGIIATLQKCIQTDNYRLVTEGVLNVHMSISVANSCLAMCLFYTKMARIAKCKRDLRITAVNMKTRSSGALFRVIY